MGFNTDKCKTMDLGAANLHHVYNMNGKDLPVTQVKEEKELGVTIDNELKVHAHTASAV